MWSDETKIKLFGINSTCRVWRGKNAEYDTIPTVKHGPLCQGYRTTPLHRGDYGWGHVIWNIGLEPHSLPLKTQPEGFGEDLQRGVDQNPSWVVYKPGDQLQETSDVCAFQQGLLHQVLSNVLLG